MAELQQDKGTQKAFGWAAKDSSGILSPFHFERRSNKDNDVTIKILYCGICHTDLSLAKNHNGFTLYPLVPGHEIVGIVTQVGTNVKKFKVGDRAGVGSIIGSCGGCDNCQDGMESYCPKMISTVTIFDVDGIKRHGGFSDFIVVDQHFAIHIPASLPLDGAAPLLCAGITVFSPMKYFGLDKPGMHLGVVGLGGLGHLAVKFAKAFGMRVSVISTSPAKKNEAIQVLKANTFVISHDSQQMQDASGTLDGIIDTVSSPHSVSPFLNLLKIGGKIILVGAPDLEKPVEVPVWPLLGRRQISGSMAGGIKETQEMMNFAAEHNITANVEVVPMDYVNNAMDRIEKGDVRYRFVIDIGKTLTIA
ncbi:hypothetical protein SLE2022_339050 [Rubroshorea leprosula]